jgi:hypothetical protein
MKAVSLCFDDGLKRTAETAMEILDIPLNFFIVTGWLEEMGLPIRDPFNIGYDHGTVEFWRQVARRHLVGGHGHTHTRLDENNALDDLLPCRQLIEEISPPPYTVAYPYLSKSFAAYSVFDWHRPFVFMPDIRKYGVSECLAQVLQAFETAKGSFAWIPIAFHGLDGEGWKSISGVELRTFVDLLAAEGVEFQAIQTIIQKMEGEDDKHVLEFRKKGCLGERDKAEDGA